MSSETTDERAFRLEILNRRLDRSPCAGSGGPLDVDRERDLYRVRGAAHLAGRAGQP